MCSLGLLLSCPQPGTGHGFCVRHLYVHCRLPSICTCTKQVITYTHWSSEILLCQYTCVTVCVSARKRACVAVCVCQSIIRLSFCQCQCVCMSYVHDIHKSNVCTCVYVCMCVCNVYTWARSRISVTLSPPVNRHLVSAVTVFRAAPGRTGVVSDSYDDVRWTLLDWYGDWWGT